MPPVKKKVVKEEAPAVSPVEALKNKLNGMLEKSSIKLASEIEGQYLVRRPFGVPSIDIAFKGGLPAGGHCIFAGEKNSGKSYLAYKCAGETQQTFGAETKIALVISEVIDKVFMKNAGFKIAFTDKEVTDYCNAYKEVYKKDLEADKVAQLKEQVGEILIIRTGSTEEALQSCVEILKSNQFHLVILDSLGGLESQDEADKDIGDKSRAQLASLLSQYTHKVMSMDYKATVIFISHVSEVQNPATPYSRKWRIPGGKAKDHLSLVTLYISKGEKIKQKIDGDDVEVGRYMNILVEKGKCGIHENIEVSTNFYYGDVTHGIVPGINKYEDLLAEAKYWEVIKGASWYELPNGEKLQGEKKVGEYFKANPEVYKQIRDECFKCANIVYLLK